MIFWKQLSSMGNYKNIFLGSVVSQARAHISRIGLIHSYQAFFMFRIGVNSDNRVIMVSFCDHKF